jgi:cell division protein FtsA
MVVDLAEVSQSVAAAVEKAQRTSGYQIRRAQVSVTGAHLSSMNSQGVVAVSRANHEIAKHDVDRTLDAARANPIASNREILHVIPQHYIIDSQEGVPNPIGMYGFRLEVKAHIVTASTAALQNVYRALEGAKVEARGLVASPLAAAEAVLSKQEKEMGVAVADIGGDTTGICIYVDRAPWYTMVLPVGSMHITRDLSVGLRLSFPMAEEFKARFGHALSTTIEAQEMVEVTDGALDTKTVSRKRGCEIIEDRVAEIFALILNEIKKSGYEGLLPGGVVLTGGGAELPGIVELGQEVLGLPVRVGVAQRVGGLVDSISSPAYASGVGLLHWGLSHEETDSGEEEQTSIDERVREFVAKLGEIIRRVIGSGK